jgi:hypothetical protein
VRVEARCNQDCVIVVKVKLPKNVARQIGVRNRVIGSGAAGAKADRFRWVRARINRRAGKLLEEFEGGGRLEVRFSALPLNAAPDAKRRSRRGCPSAAFSPWLPWVAALRN